MDDVERRRDVEYLQYVDSGCWRCDNSPTGAHHWVEHLGLWFCIYCSEARRFPMTFTDATHSKPASTRKSMRREYEELLRIAEEVEHDRVST